MAIGPRLEFRQARSLVMTPQLQQAIKLLQLTSMDLTAYVEQELERNPLLDRERPDNLGDTGAAAADDTANRDAPGSEVDSADAGSDVSSPDSADALVNDLAVAERAADTDADYENVWDGDRSVDSGGLGGTSPWGKGGGGFDEDGASWEESIADQPTLRVHLETQLNLECKDPADQMIGLRLIDLIDQDGYMRADMAELSEELGADLTQVEALLSQIQTLEPVGIGARNLAECFALQLKDRDRYDPAMQGLVENLQLLADKDFKTLRAICGVDGDDLVDMISELKLLDPKPGSSFEAPPVEVVAPDVLMRRGPDGDWIVELNPETMPRVLVDTGFCESLRAKVREKTDREFLTENLSSANWLVKALQQRAHTILKASAEIVRRQDAFFQHGVIALRPMTLKDVAEVIEMHESTISRVVNGKYVATPRGVVELKSFFTAAIAGVGGGETSSAEAVRLKIKRLIDEEASNAVLSDDQIVALLKIDGIEIARRTVAKYREALYIPSSVQRRRQKLALAS